MLYSNGMSGIQRYRDIRIHQQVWFVSGTKPRTFKRPDSPNRPCWRGQTKHSVNGHWRGTVYSFDMASNTTLLILRGVYDNSSETQPLWNKQSTILGITITFTVSIYISSQYGYKLCLTISRIDHFLDLCGLASLHQVPCSACCRLGRFLLGLLRGTFHPLYEM